MARARTYRHDIICRRCGSNWMPKDGHIRGRQVYKYGDCKRKYTADAEQPSSRASLSKSIDRWFRCA